MEITNNDITNSIINKGRKYGSLLIALLLLLTYSTTALAQEKEKKTVRVGWYESPFNHTDRNGQRQGYAYEYQRRIAANTGWTYEYVEGNWAELFEMLKRGEIDILSDVTKSPEREGMMLFPEWEMGVEDYGLLALVGNKDIRQNEPATLNGKHIGVLHGTYQAELVKKWAKEHSINASITEYVKSENELLDLLKNKQVDALAVTSAFNYLSKEMCKPIGNIGSAKIYFAINKNRPDLKEDIDKALTHIRISNLYYNRDLHEKYFSNTTYYSHLAESEGEWLKTHGTITIGYRDNYLPYCGTDEKTGEVTGLLRDFIEKMEKLHGKEGLKFKAIAYPTINDALEAVVTHKVDLAFPEGLGTYDMEKLRLASTEPIVKSAELAVIRSYYSLTTDTTVRAAINANNPSYLSLIREKYPDMQIVHFPSTKECLRGVARNKADLLFISNFRLGVLDCDIEDLGLKAVATGAEIPMAFAVNEGEADLFSLMCRLTRQMPRSEVQAALTSYAETHNYSIGHFISKHYGLFSLFLVCIIAIFVYLFIRSWRDHRRANLANKAKTQFLFNMSHDIRTPMNAIIGYTDMMKKNLNDKEKCEDYLKKISTSSNFLLSLINNVLEMSRIDSGKAELDEQPLFPGAVSRELVSVYDGIMKEKDITFTYTSDVNTQFIYYDPLKIKEVLLNLISNAYKYTPRGGKVSLELKELPSDREGYIVIQTKVSDSGVGMSKEFLPTIFEQFSREKGSSGNRIQGTGLGLSIVKKLVDLMHGTITVESELGKGTTFIVTIPHRIANGALLNTEDAEVQKEISFKGKRILMAEDNDLNAEIAEAILVDLGLKVERAVDGVECVQMLADKEAGYYDLILMDVQMPNMNGYEATDKIRRLKDEDKAFLPIVAMTANAFEEDKEAAIRAGMNSHLAKPIDITLLTQTLEEMIGE